MSFISNIKNTFRVNNVADLATLKPINNQVYEILGYYNVGDGGGQLVYYNSSSTATANNGTVLEA